MVELSKMVNQHHVKICACLLSLGILIVCVMGETLVTAASNLSPSSSSCANNEGDRRSNLDGDEISSSKSSSSDLFPEEENAGPTIGESKSSDIIDTTKNTNGNMNREVSNQVPDDCSIVLADSSIKDGGWGMFTLKPITKGEMVYDGGDPVIQIPDLNPQYAHEMKRILWDYLWDGQVTFGQYEGARVMSMIPGIGMLANGESNLHNVVPSNQKPEIDNAGQNNGREQSPGAGAFTYYHNLTWYAERDIMAGGEIFLDYGEGWFKERGYFNQPPPTEVRTIPWLVENGYCLDSIRPGISTIEYAGRGAFATRDLEVGTVVAPIPVLPLSTASLGMIKEHEQSGRMIFTEQLLKNYCFGHNKSSLLLYPYSPIVNLINHYVGTSQQQQQQQQQPNVELRWAESSLSLFSKPLSALQEPSSRLLLELVALKPINEGDEILLDYGKDWTDAWDNHVESWRNERAHLGEQQQQRQHVSSRTMDQLIRQLPIETELRTQPYPEHIFTSCYYNYADRQMDAAADDGPTTTFVWEGGKSGLFESRYLRPCFVLQRQQTKQGRDGNYSYTVRILNRPGLAQAERIPKGIPHIVTGVPRDAIRFSEKLYTTDQHLESAFRKEIGLPNNTFPSQWMDLI